MYTCIQISYLVTPRTTFNGRKAFDLEALSPIPLPVAAIAVPKANATEEPNIPDIMYYIPVHMFSELTSMLGRDYRGWYEQVAFHDTLDVAYRL